MENPMKTIFAIALLLAACTNTVPSSNGTTDPSDVGSDGATGLQGPVGPVGPAGSAGLAGAAGVPGATGPQGLTGPAGATGAPGPAGIDGVGVAGTQGSAGATGPQGSVGPTGATGARGPSGMSTQLIVYDRSGKRLGIHAAGPHPVGGFVTYGTDAFPTPDGVYVSMAPTNVYFDTGGCVGQAYVQYVDTDYTIANQYFWTTSAFYKKSAQSGSVVVHARKIGDACFNINTMTLTGWSLAVVPSAYNMEASLPWTLTIE